MVSCLEFGVTYYDETQNYFKEHFDKLAPVFIKERKVTLEINAENKEDICKMHDAYINEIRTDFSAALGKDRLYHLAAGFVKDQLSWLIGVQLHYAMTKVLHFNHEDFLSSLKIDL